MANMTYRVKIVREGYQFEADGDRKFVLEMLARFEKQAPAMPSKPAPSRDPKERTASPLALTGKGISPGEFIRQFRFKKHTDFVLAFGYYLEKHSGLQAFSAADINNCYYEAKMESSNTSQMIIQDIKRGYMMEAKGKLKEQKGGRKLFTLTRSGEEYLQQATSRDGDE